VFYVIATLQIDIYAHSLTYSLTYLLTCVMKFTRPFWCSCERCRRESHFRTVTV